MTVTPKQAAAERAYVIRRRRARSWLWRLFIWVVLPTLLSIVYYSFIAASEYESITTVSAARGTTSEAGSCERKAALIRDVFLSRAEILSAADKLGLHAHYRHGDLLSRLGGGAGKEETYHYLRDHISLSDPTPACTMTVKVRAYNPVLSRDIAQTLIAATNARLYQLANQENLPETGQLVLVNGPSLPDDAAYPRRFWSVITVLVVSFVAVGVVSLFAGAVREHAKL